MGVRNLEIFNVPEISVSLTGWTSNKQLGGIDGTLFGSVFGGEGRYVGINDTMEKGFRRNTYKVFGTPEEAQNHVDDNVDQSMLDSMVMKVFAMMLDDIGTDLMSRVEGYKFCNTPFNYSISGSISSAGYAYKFIIELGPGIGTDQMIIHTVMRPQNVQFCDDDFDSVAHIYDNFQQSLHIVREMMVSITQRIGNWFKTYGDHQLGTESDNVCNF